MKSALLVVDVQNDFCEGGVLPALDTNTLTAPLEVLLQQCASAGIPCIFTRDWHPPNHGSFLEYGGIWPVHCVQGSWGAGFASGISLPADSWIIDEGVEVDDDGYSAFARTGLDARLRDAGITDLAICGIATEYCVLTDVKDARALNYRVLVLDDLIRPIEKHPGDAAQALDEMESTGAKFLTSCRWAEAGFR